MKRTTKPANRIKAQGLTYRQIQDAIAAHFAQSSSSFTVVKKIGMFNYSFVISKAAGHYTLRKGEDIIDTKGSVSTITTVMLDNWNLH
jgi:pectin methylesterase-like acyl-CoA thioesterase